MTLDRNEQVELSQLLLQASQGGPLDAVEWARLRALVIRENPRVANHADKDLVSAGLIALGALWFIQGPPPEEWHA